MSSLLLLSSSSAAHTDSTTLSLSDLHSTLGVLFISNLFVAVLFGVTSVQTYIYHQRCTRDSALMKGAVYVLWILDALHFAFISHTVYQYAINNFMNASVLLEEIWSLSGSMIVAGISDLIVTAILAHRIWKFNTAKCVAKIAVLIIAPATLCIVSGDIAIPILALRKPGTYQAFAQKYSWLWYMTFSARAAVDVIIAASIYLMLYPYRTGFRRTSSAIRLIILYTINTCALTTVFAILSVVLYAALPHSFVGFSTAMQLPKLILNSLLAILNSRQGMREIFSAYDSVRVQPTDVSRPVVLHDWLSTQSIYSQTRSKNYENGREESAPRSTLLQMSQAEQAV